MSFWNHPESDKYPESEYFLSLSLYRASSFQNGVIGDLEEDVGSQTIRGLF